MNSQRLLALIAVALINPLIVDLQLSRGRLAPLGHFPAVAGAVFLAVLARLSFVGVEHVRAIRRLNSLIDAHRRISRTQSAAELARVAADAAGVLLGGRGEASIVLEFAGRLHSATWQPPHTLTRFDPDHWRSLIAGWGSAGQQRGLERFLAPQDIRQLGARGALTALACPIDTARSPHQDSALGVLLVVGARGRVTGATEALALLAAQVGESVGPRPNSVNASTPSGRKPAISVMPYSGQISAWTSASRSCTTRLPCSKRRSALTVTGTKW